MIVDKMNNTANYTDSTRPSEISKLTNNSITQQKKTVADTKTSVNTLTMNTNSINLEIQNDGKESVNQQQLKQAVEQANAKRNMKTRCEFAYHEDINRVSIKVLNQDTDEVIREIPAEETLEMIQKIFDLAGLMVDEKR